jgi:hypothetical protein
MYSNELEAAVLLQKSPFRPNLHPRRVCYMRRVLPSPEERRENSQGLQPRERLRNEIALKGRPSAP